MSGELGETQPEVRRLMSDIFGDSDEDDDAPPLAPRPPPSESAGPARRGLDDIFESDEEEPPLRKRVPKRGREETGPAKSSAKKKGSPSAPKKPAASESRESSDEYDSDVDVRKTAEDEAFIDAEDDNADLLAEYAQERQDFRDDRPKGAGQRKDVARASDSDPVSQMLVEMKGQRAARLTEEEKQTFAQELLFRMDKAAKDDDQLFEARQPALCKVNMLESVQRVVAVKELQHTLLEFDLLGVLRGWIEPRDAKVLPSLTVRKAVYDMLTRLPCQVDHLKRSGIGRTVALLRKHKGEIPENKARLKELMEKWSRHIFGNAPGSAYEESAKEFELRLAAQQRREAERRALGESRGSSRLEEALTARGSDVNEAYSRARTPVNSGFIFTVRPDTRGTDRIKAPRESTGGKAELIKRMKGLQKEGMRVKLGSK